MKRAVHQFNTVFIIPVELDAYNYRIFLVNVFYIMLNLCIYVKIYLYEIVKLRIFVMCEANNPISPYILALLR